MLYLVIRPPLKEDEAEGASRSWYPRFSYWSVLSSLNVDSYSVGFIQLLIVTALVLMIDRDFSFVLVSMYFICIFYAFTFSAGSVLFLVGPWQEQRGEAGRRIFKYNYQMSKSLSNIKIISKCQNHQQMSSIPVKQRRRRSSSWKNRGSRPPQRKPGKK